MVEVSLTVGKLDASLALLLTKDHHLIEFPTILLPDGIKAGSIVKIKCEQDLGTELAEQEQFEKIQDEILNAFGRNLPSPPLLKIKNVTQTSCVLEWDQLELGTASIKNLILLKDGKKLGVIPQPMTNRTTKMSGLPIDKAFQFQLRLDTTAGVYSSDVVEVITHKMTDLSGITVCLGDFSPNDPFTRDDIESALKHIGAKPAQDEIKVDTTHYLCTKEVPTNPEYIKASDMNIPIVRPEWLKACERERRIVGVRDFYVKECVLPDIFANNYWGDKSTPVETTTVSKAAAEATPTPEEAKPEVISRPGEPEIIINPPEDSLEAELPSLPKGEAVQTEKTPEESPELATVKSEEHKHTDIVDATEPVKEVEPSANEAEPINGSEASEEASEGAEEIDDASGDLAGATTQVETSESHETLDKESSLEPNATPDEPAELLHEVDINGVDQDLSTSVEKSKPEVPEIIESLVVESETKEDIVEDGEASETIEGEAVEGEVNEAAEDDTGKTTEPVKIEKKKNKKKKNGRK